MALFMAPASAGAFELALPVACDLGKTCFIQHYPDHDPGPAAQDHACGSLTYDGHDGTDFALNSLSAMQTGVAVLAAAPGVVRGARDGRPDISVSDPGAPPLDGMDCGNGVAIQHEGGYETQYCHLKQGSLRVKPGDRVEAGTPLGEVGLSGNTEFPHLHLTLRQNGVAIDPAAPRLRGCGGGGPDLWQADLPPPVGGIIAAGFAPQVPEFAQIKQGDVPAPVAKSDGMVLWAYLYGTRAGDRLVLDLQGPEGRIIADSLALERTQAQSFRAIGQRLRAAQWPAGVYSGTAILTRNGAEIDRAEVSLSLP
ncbi:M23 family metallopeptidase [Gemmobacter sp.]|uniref:M23 family metallopeptidase n=1 Tax=Gemmobacter sp. TaxID=1898957 RepID=UPI0025BB302B|nr:M23 family metallopeptidase [Gemmobacter sp.]